MESRTRVFVVSGATGFIGSALVRFLASSGHRVVRLRRPARQDVDGPVSPAVTDATWDPDRGILPAAALEGADAVIHLAGASIAGGRWTRARKRLLLESRVRGTSLLARTIATLGSKPGALVSVSAVGIYGDRGDEVLEDSAPPGRGFLADVARAWEQAADPAREAGVRTMHPRLGMVLSPAGGALERLLLPFRLGLGGRMGSGRQWMAWASLDDVLRILVWSALTARTGGAFNAVSPDVVRNAEFARALGRALGRPAVFPAPAPALTLAFGEMAREVLLSSQRAVPTRLLGDGYPWQQPVLEQALRHVLGGVA